MTRGKSVKTDDSARPNKARRSFFYSKPGRHPTEMRKCLVQLKRMVPTIEQNEKINQLELLQHVINYIQDLEVTLQHPSTIIHAVSPCRESPDAQ